MSVLNKKTKVTNYGVLTDQCARALLQMTDNRMKLKFHLDAACAEYDDYITERGLPISKIGNPFNYNRLNEDEQADVWGLTLGKVGGGNDSIEGYEFKTAEYNGVNKRTNLLNSHAIYFNGKPIFKTLEESMDYMKTYLGNIKGLKIAIRVPDGRYIHFESKMDKATKGILLEFANKKFEKLKNKRLKDPRMNMGITTAQLLKNKNLKLLKGTDEAFARKYLGNTFDMVV